MAKSTLAPKEQGSAANSRRAAAVSVSRLLHKYGFLLIAFGLALITRKHGGWTWLLLWPALSFLIVGVAYALREPRIFGKQSDGTLAWWSILLLFPFLLYSWLLWNIVRLAHRVHSREPYASRIAPRLWLSRRILRDELPDGVTCVVDMTCEFPAAPGLVKRVPHYFVLPTLDYGAPDPARALALLEKIEAIDGEVLMHCAQGHGRSAMLAAGWLVMAGAAKDADEAERIVKRGRRNMRLGPWQKAALRDLVQLILLRRAPATPQK